MGDNADHVSYVALFVIWVVLLDLPLLAQSCASSCHDKQLWMYEPLTYFRNNSIRSTLKHLGLSESNFQSLLNQPNQFLNSFNDSAEAEKIRSDLIVAYRKGFRVVFIVGAGLAAAATLTVVLLMPQVPLDRPDDKELKEEGGKSG